MMQLVKQEKFGTLVMDFYMDENKEIFATRKQIGEALSYSDPQNAIDKIHSKHTARFEGKSVTAKLAGSDGKSYDTTLYNTKGIMEICRWARTDKADEFFDWVTDVIDELRINGVVVSVEATHEQVIYQVDNFLNNLDNYSVTKLYGMVEGFLNFHREKKTKLPFKRTHKARHGNKKYKEHIDSMEEIREELVAFLNAKIDMFNSSNQAGLAQEYIRIREMVRVSVENMRFRTAACSK